MVGPLGKKPFSSLGRSNPRFQCRLSSQTLFGKTAKKIEKLRGDFSTVDGGKIERVSGYGSGISLLGEADGSELLKHTFK